MKSAILIDLDGCLVDNDARFKKWVLEQQLKGIEYNDYAWADFFEKSIDDLPNDWCLQIINRMYLSYDVIFLTGRSDDAQEVTIRWLKKYLPMDMSFHLFMRKSKDERKDSVIKNEILNDVILPRFKILFALDDRTQNIEMFRENGIVALQCADNS